ncbi:hypothetical protein ACJZ2D_009568 [Fusarium nematophilum]
MAPPRSIRLVAGGQNAPGGTELEQRRMSPLKSLERQTPEMPHLGPKAYNAKVMIRTCVRGQYTKDMKHLRISPGDGVSTCPIEAKPWAARYTLEQRRNLSSS